MTLKMNTKTTSLLPCQSGKHYDECCHLLHSSRKIAETAEMLIRSRYAAFHLLLDRLHRKNDRAKSTTFIRPTCSTSLSNKYSMDKVENM